MGQGQPGRVRGCGSPCRLTVVSRRALTAALAASLLAAVPADAWKITRVRTENGVRTTEVGRRCGASKLGVYKWTASGRRDGKTFVFKWDEYVIKADGRYRNLHQTYVGGTVFSSLPNKTRRAKIAEVFASTNATQVALLKGGQRLRYRREGLAGRTVAFAARPGC